MSRIAFALSLALTLLVGSFGIGSPAHATGVRILVAQCSSESAPCWIGSTPTPWSYNLTGAQLSDIGLGTSQALYAQQIGCCVIRLGSLEAVFQTPGGPVTETAPEYNGAGVNGLFIATHYLIPADATSGVLSGTFGNSTVPNSSLENLYFGVVISSVPEPATWAIMLLGLGAAGGMLRRSARARLNGRVQAAA